MAMDKQTKMMVLAGGVVLLVVIIVVVVMMMKKKEDACKDIKDTDDFASGKMTNACYVQLLQNHGCYGTDKTKLADSVKLFPVMATWNKKRWDEDAKEWATLTDDDHRRGCYGTDKTKWPVAYIRYSRF